MELEMKPYVLECSCCVSHIVPFLIHYLCNTYFFLFPFPSIFSSSCNRIPPAPPSESTGTFLYPELEDFDALIKHETLNQRNKFTSLTA